MSCLNVIIENEKIYMLDMYSRLRICDMNGKIELFEFNMNKNGIIMYKNEIKNIKDVISCDEQVIKILRVEDETVILTTENIFVVKENHVSKLNYLKNIKDICMNEKKEIICYTNDKEFVKFFKLVC